MDLRCEKGIDLYEIDAFSNWFNLFLYQAYYFVISTYQKKNNNLKKKKTLSCHLDVDFGFIF